MPRERARCKVMLKAHTDDALARQIRSLRIDVPPRIVDPGRSAREQRQIHDLLCVMLAIRQLALPVQLYKREKPDFLLETNNIQIGIETVQAINCDYVQAQVHPDAQEDGAVVDPSLYKWSTQGRPQAQIREEVRREQLSGLAWMGDSVELEFAQSIRDTVRKKRRKLLSHYERYDSDRLHIYHNQPSPILNIEKGLQYTASILFDYWNEPGFDTIYVRKFDWMLSFTKEASEIIYEFPRSSVPLGIDEDLWEQLGYAEKLYLKLLEQEPTFISDTGIGETDIELEEYFGFENDLQALRHEWFTIRDRELQEAGFSDLLKPPNRIRLMTASEVAACPAALDLFRNGLLEHVFRAIAEPVPDNTSRVIPSLSQTVASRGPEFRASVSAILYYLSKLANITHWASDSRKCTALLSTINPQD